MTDARELPRLQIAPLGPADHAAWEPLAQAYKAFYQTETRAPEYAAAWQRLQHDACVHGLGAWEVIEAAAADGLLLGPLPGPLLGIAHYVLHANVWAPRVCYLQDLYVTPAARGRGVARALIDAVAAQARQAGAQRYYWLTQADNAQARRLYDRLGRHNGFIRYDYPL